MGMFRIHKKGTRNFWHSYGTKTDQEFSDWNINIDHQGQKIILTMPNGATFPKLEVPIADVRVKVLTGSDETFATTELLRARLVEIGYNPLVAPSSGGSQNLQEVLTVGGRGVKLVDTTLGDYTLLEEDKALALILDGDTAIDIIIPNGVFTDGDTIPIYNPNGSASYNFDLSLIPGTFTAFNPLLPSYKAELLFITYDSNILCGVSYESDGLSSSGIPDAPNDANAYVRSGLAWVIGYTKSAIDTLLNLKADILTLEMPDFWQEVQLFSTIGNTSLLTANAISSGTNSTAIPLSNISGKYPYGVFLRSSTTANGGYRYQTPSLTYDHFGDITHKNRFIVEWLTDFTGRSVRMGYFDSTSITDAVDGAYFEIVGDVVNCKTANNSTRTTNTMTAVLSLDTNYLFDIEVNALGTLVTFTLYNADTETLIEQTTISTNIPTASNRAFGSGIVATESSTTASDMCIFRYFGIGTINGYNKART